METGDAESVTFEQRSYEAIIASVVDIQTQDYDVCSFQAQEILADFKVASIISVEKQEQMRILKNKVSGMISNTNAYRKSMEDLLEDDEGLAMMNLTKLKKKPFLYSLPLANEIISTREEMEVSWYLNMQLFRNYLLLLFTINLYCANLMATRYCWSLI